MNTPITYYGGKQTLLHHILPRLYKGRELYVEPFFGGGAVFFGKNQETNEVINDNNDFVINFYEVFKSDFTALNTMIQATLYSESLYERAIAIYRSPCNYDKVTKAWAFWCLSIMSFGRLINDKSGFSFRIQNSGECPRRLMHKKHCFGELSSRLNNVCIRNINALECIQKYDFDKAFFYIDPPYVGANQGHYKGYTQNDFNKLLEVLSRLHGKFLLSSYNNDKLIKYINQYGWYKYEIETQNNMSCDKNGNKKRKIEVLTANYDMDEQSEWLKFDF